MGINITDIAQLERRHIRNGRWYYERSKTGVGLAKEKPLLPEALAIIEKYDTGKKYIFDILNGYNDTEKRKVNRIQDVSKLITKFCKKASKKLGLVTLRSILLVILPLLLRLIVVQIEIPLVTYSTTKTLVRLIIMLVGLMTKK